MADYHLYLKDNKILQIIKLDKLNVEYLTTEVSHDEACRAILTDYLSPNSNPHPALLEKAQQAWFKYDKPVTFFVIYESNLKTLVSNFTSKPIPSHPITVDIKFSEINQTERILSTTDIPLTPPGNLVWVREGILYVKDDYRKEIRTFIWKPKPDPDLEVLYKESMTQLHCLTYDLTQEEYYRDSERLKRVLKVDSLSKARAIADKQSTDNKMIQR